MRLDAQVDAAYPQRWTARVSVRTVDGRELQGRVDEPEGDSGNPLSRAELQAKALRLAQYGGAATDAEMASAFAQIWNLASLGKVGRLLPAPQTPHRTA